MKNIRKKIDWFYRYMISCFQCKLLRKIMPFDKFWHMRIRYYKRYIGEYMELEAANEQLKAWIREGVPFAVTRNGMGETAMFVSLIQDSVWNSQTFVKHAMALSFDKDRDLMQRYFEMILQMYRETDMLCAWFVVNMEEYGIAKYYKNRFLTSTSVVDLYAYDTCWIRELKGKRVLVISPFVDTMTEQYRKRELLHKDPETLPEFTLLTVKAVWWYSQGRDPRFQSWFEVLDYLYDECMKLEFDIALLSCGSFGSPLVVRLKQAGKQAVYMGGMLQLLFGIRGKRWDKIPGLYNEHWVSLPEETKFGNINTLDNTQGGPYW